MHDERNDDEYCIENVESVPRVLPEAETDYLDDHFGDETPAENVVESLRDLLALQVSRIAIQGQYKRVRHDQQSYHQGEHPVRTNDVTNLEQPVALSTLR